MAFIAIPARAQPKPFCFRGHSLETCEAFALLELGGSWQVAGTSQRVTSRSGEIYYRADLPGRFNAEVGGMVNRDSTHAIGGTVQLAGTMPGARVSVNVRRRTWYEGGKTMDLSVGVFTARAYSAIPDVTIKATGLTAGVAWGDGDFAGVVVSGDLAYDGRRPRTAVHVGLRVGSFVSLAILALSPLLILPAAAAGGN